MGQLFTGSVAIRGIRGPIPSGFIVGRTSTGSGPPELVSYAQLGQKMQQSGVPVTRLSALQDVAFGTLTDKQHLEYNAAAGKWVNVAAPALATLTDVVEAAPANGQVLTFELATNKWKNKNPSANQVNNYLGPTTVGLTSFQPGIGALFTHGNWGGVPALISAGMNVTDVRFYATAAAASAVVTPAIYADNAGAPGALIAVGAATTGVVQGLNSFACAYASSVDQVIWLGVLVETADINLAMCDYKPNAFFAAAGPLPPNTAGASTFQIGPSWASMWADVLPAGVTSSPLSSLSPAVLGLVMAGSLSTSVSLAAAETLGLVMTATLQTGVVAVAASMLIGITMAATLSVTGGARTNPAFVNAGAMTTITTSASSIGLALPASRVVGQLMIAYIWNNGVVITTAPAGWTKIIDTTTVTSGYATAYYRYIDGTETGTQTFATAGSTNSVWFGLIAQYSNVRAAGSGGPVGALSAISGASSPRTAPAVTTTDVNSTLVLFGSPASISGQSFGTPTGFTSDANVNGSTTASGITIYHRDMTTLGSANTAWNSGGTGGTTWREIIVELIAA